MPVPTALTIAASDSGGGAGIQADLRTFTVYGVYGMTAITAVTVQNTCGVFDIIEMSPEAVVAQIDAVVQDIGVHAAKTGALINASIVEAVADAVRRYRIYPLVVDPVIRAGSGTFLLKPGTEDVLVKRLLPLATVVTPNIPEAERFVGFALRTREDVQRAAQQLHAMGPQVVVIKGGHGGADGADDLFFDGVRFRWIPGIRIETPHTHGTGCTFSAAIAAGLARGWDVWTSVKKAKAFVTQAIVHAPGLGHGHGPLHHMWSSQIPFDREDSS